MMSKTAVLITYKLTEGADVQAFLAAAEALNNGYMSKQNGYIAWEQLVNEENLWADLITWETMEDAQKIMKDDTPNPLAEKFYAFIDMPSCIPQLFSVEKSY